MAKRDNGHELVVKERYALLAQPTEDLSMVVAQNLGPGGMSVFDLDRIRVPAGGGLSWAVQSLEGERSEKTLEGIILHWRQPRAYWAQSFADSGGGSPPDCTSEDGTTGVGSPGGPCAKCPLSQWGSDPRGGKGQACRQMRLLFFLRPENMLPDVVFLPPTSIKPVQQYFLRLTSQGIPYFAVTTKLSLEKTQSGGGIAYSRVVPSLGERLPLEQVAQIRKFIDALRPSLDRVKVEEADYAGAAA